MTTMTNMRRTTDEDYYTRRRLTTRPRRPSPSRSAPNKIDSVPSITESIESKTVEKTRKCQDSDNPFEPEN